jgi:hypothetical protein
LGSGQAFFTTTDLEGIKDYIGDMKEKVQIFTVKTGEMEEVLLSLSRLNPGFRTFLRYTQAGR